MQKVHHSEPGQRLTYGQVMLFFSPLALSWIMMGIESPVASGLIQRLPNPQLNTAAFQVMFALALWIESPVIDLLSTSTTLAKDRQHYTVLSRFVWWLMAWVTVAHTLVAVTPLFDLVMVRLMNIPRDVSEAIRPAFIIMIPWSACIGWRRYLQGILIRYGQTRMVGAGTIVRLTTVSTSGFLLYRFSHLTGIEVAAVALICSVFAEAMFAHWASRETVKHHFGPDGDELVEPKPLTMGQLLKFHLPLTATTMVMFLGGPMVSSALAHSTDSVLALAAWQVCTTILFLLRTVVFALPEVVITLARSPESAKVMARFCTIVGFSASSLILGLALTGLDMWFFTQVLRTDLATAERAHLGFLAGAAMPILGALQSYVRGMLTANHLTVSRLYAVAVAIATLAVALPVTHALGLPGVLVASISLTIALAAELAALAWVWRTGSRRLAAKAALS